MNFTGNLVKLTSETVKKGAGGGCLISLLSITMCVIGTGAGIQSILSSARTDKAIAVNENHLTDK